MVTRLSDWLTWQETLHPSVIDLGLDRVREVLRRLHWQPPTCPVITIAGTKGKGSCAALLESMLSAAGYRTGLFTSPHLQRYNERIRIAQQDISDESLCSAFARINTARADISLTYFEFNTLAALLTFTTAELDVWVLEVGMGGRLDAVNVVDADVAIVTSVGIDHTEWLGDTVERIGREKAGVLRPHRPALFASAAMPQSVQTVADELAAVLFRAQRDFGFTADHDQWHWWMNHDSGRIQLHALPLPGIQGAIQIWNASAALTALHILSARLPMTRDAIDNGLRQVRLPGRFQIITCPTLPGVEWILDVAHNPMSATILAEHLQVYRRDKGDDGRVVAIIGVLADKDLHGMVLALRDQVDEWITVGLPGARALSTTLLTERLLAVNVSVRATLNNVESACEFACQCFKVLGKAPGRILVCGSFMTVAPALAWLDAAVRRDTLPS